MQPVSLQCISASPCIAAEGTCGSIKLYRAQDMHSTALKLGPCRRHRQSSCDRLYGSAQLAYVKGEISCSKHLCCRVSAATCHPVTGRSRLSSPAQHHNANFSEYHLLHDCQDMPYSACGQLHAEYRSLYSVTWRGTNLNDQIPLQPFYDRKRNKNLRMPQAQHKSLQHSCSTDLRQKIICSWNTFVSSPSSLKGTG